MNNMSSVNSVANPGYGRKKPVFGICKKRITEGSVRKAGDLFVPG
jgi:hypothetical protein